MTRIGKRPHGKQLPEVYFKSSQLLSLSAEGLSRRPPTAGSDWFLCHHPRMRLPACPLHSPIRHAVEVRTDPVTPGLLPESSSSSAIPHGDVKSYRLL